MLQIGVPYLLLIIKSDISLLLQASQNVFCPLTPLKQP